MGCNEMMGRYDGVRVRVLLMKGMEVGSEIGGVRVGVLLGVRVGVLLMG